MLTLPSSPPLYCHSHLLFTGLFPPIQTARVEEAGGPACHSPEATVPTVVRLLWFSLSMRRNFRPFVPNKFKASWSIFRNAPLNCLWNGLWKGWKDFKLAFKFSSEWVQNFSIALLPLINGMLLNFSCGPTKCLGYKYELCLPAMSWSWCVARGSPGMFSSHIQLKSPQFIFLDSCCF